MSMGAIIAVDIGGTHLRAALYEPERTQPIAHQRVETHADKPDVYGRMQALIESIWPKDREVEAIAVASPGPLDPHTGYILKTPNISEWQNFPLGPTLSKHFHVPAYLDNDANLAALGEWRFGAGTRAPSCPVPYHQHGCRRRCESQMTTFLQGFHGLATELGHTIIDPDGPLCSCGYAGHLEAFSSGPAIVRYVHQELLSGARSALEGE